MPKRKSVYRGKLFELESLYIEKIKNLGTLINEKIGISERHMLYPTMDEDVYWAALPNLTELVGMSDFYQLPYFDSDDISGLEEFAEDHNVILSLLDEDATKPEQILDKKYNIILDKRGFRALRLTVPYMRKRSSFDHLLEMPDSLSDKDIEILASRVQGSEWTNDFSNIYEEYKDNPKKQNDIRKAIEIIKCCGAIKIWDHYLPFLEERGVIVSFDILSSYLRSLGLDEVSLTEEEKNSVHFSEEESMEYPTILNTDECWPYYPMLVTPRIFVKTKPKE